MNLKTRRELKDLLLNALDAKGLITDQKAAADDLLGVLKRLNPIFPLQDRLSCAVAAEACAPMLGEAPEQGWCAFCYDFLRARMFPQIAFPPETERYEHGALVFLCILQALLDYEDQILFFDPRYDFEFLSPEEFKNFDSAEEYRRFLDHFRNE